MWGIEGLHRVGREGGRRLLKHTPEPPPALLTGCLPSASSQLGLREELHHQHPPTSPTLFVLTETKRPQLSTLVPPLLHML